MDKGMKEPPGGSYHWGMIFTNCLVLMKLKGMATHSSIFAWMIAWTEELGRPQSMGWQRVEHN